VQASSLLPTAVGVLLLLAAAATPATREVSLYDGQVTLSLPTGWREIPQEELELYTLQMTEATGGRVTETYQYGFQPEGAKGLRAYPQILVQVKESGRLPYGPLLRLPSLEAAREAQGTRTNTSGPLMDNITLDQLFFDHSRYALRVSSSLDLADVGKVGVHTASFLTERGRFVVHCYDLLPRFELTAPLFDDLIRSVRFAPPLAYRPRLSDRYPALADLDWRHWALAGLIVALAVALAVTVRRQRRQRPG
jgi:hypothetical protein